MKKLLICILVVLTLVMSIGASCGGCANKSKETESQETESQESPDAGWKDEF